MTTGSTHHDFPRVARSVFLRAMECSILAAVVAGQAAEVGDQLVETLARIHVDVGNRRRVVEEQEAP